MNLQKTIIAIFLTLIISMMAGCTSSNTQLPSTTATQDLPPTKISNTPSMANQPFPLATTTTKPPATINPATSVLPTVPSTVPATLSSLALIPGGEFEMGDHIGVIDPKHPSDEIPIHKVMISQFYAGKVDITVSEYCDFLNSAFAQSQIKVSGGLVYLSAGQDVLFHTREADQYSRISWDGSRFGILDNRGNHPITSVLWHGAAAYCNWLSVKDGFTPCYNTSSWECDFSKNGYRLPTEAEWEYAARGGQYNPYYNYPWGNEADKTKANWPGSGDPYETALLPWTTPVGFYNGKLQIKSNFGWSSNQASYQTSNGVNDYGLFDMAGNVWQWCNDWYGRDYYKVSPAKDPTGPTMAEASLMPDGKPYRVLRGGNWFNGEADALMPGVDNGHSRVSNRDPAYYRGPQDPNHPYYHVGFRVVRRN